MLAQNPLRRAHFDSAPRPLRLCAAPTSTLRRAHFDEFGAACQPGEPRSLEDLDDLPSPAVIAREIVEDLTAALVEFEAVAAALEASEAGGAVATDAPAS